MSGIRRITRVVAAIVVAASTLAMVFVLPASASQATADSGGPRADIIILLDESGSMAHNDPCDNGDGCVRYLIVDSIAAYLQERVRLGADVRLAVFSFSSMPTPLIPLTPVTSLEYPTGGIQAYVQTRATGRTQFGYALTAASSHLAANASQSTFRRSMVLMITDTDPGLGDGSEVDFQSELVRPINELRQRGVRVGVLAVDCEIARQQKNVAAWQSLVPPGNLAVTSGAGEESADLIDPLLRTPQRPLSSALQDLTTRDVEPLRERIIIEIETPDPDSEERTLWDSRGDAHLLRRGEVGCEWIPPLRLRYTLEHPAAGQYWLALEQGDNLAGFEAVAPQVAVSPSSAHDGTRVVVEESGFVSFMITVSCGQDQASLVDRSANLLVRATSASGVKVADVSVVAQGASYGFSIPESPDLEGDVSLEVSVLYNGRDVSLGRAAFTFLHCPLIKAIQPDNGYVRCLVAHAGNIGGLTPQVYVTLVSRGGPSKPLLNDEPALVEATGWASVQTPLLETGDWYTATVRLAGGQIGDTTLSFPSRSKSTQFWLEPRPSVRARIWSIAKELWMPLAAVGTLGFVFASVYYSRLTFGTRSIRGAVNAVKKNRENKAAVLDAAHRACSGWKVFRPLVGKPIWAELPSAAKAVFEAPGDVYTFLEKGEIEGLSRVTVDLWNDAVLLLGAARFVDGLVDREDRVASELERLHAIRNVERTTQFFDTLKRYLGVSETIRNLQRTTREALRRHCAYAEKAGIRVSGKGNLLHIAQDTHAQQKRFYCELRELDGRTPECLDKRPERRLLDIVEAVDEQPPSAGATANPDAGQPAVAANGSGQEASDGLATPSDAARPGVPWMSRLDDLERELGNFLSSGAWSEELEEIIDCLPTPEQHLVRSLEILACVKRAAGGQTSEARGSGPSDATGQPAGQE